MAVTATTLRLQQKLRNDLLEVTNAQVRDLVAAWADAWDVLAPEATAAILKEIGEGDKAVTVSQLLRSKRLIGALAAIQEQLEKLNEVARERMIGDLQRVVDAAGAAQAGIVQSQMPPGSTLIDLDAWSRVDPGQIAAIVTRTTQQMTSLTEPLSDQAYAAVQSELIRGIAVGANPRDTAARIVKRAEGQFNGGLNRAMVIARTETLDAHRAAAALSQAEDADVLAGWVWLAKLDARTCRSCWAQHGQLHDLDELGPLDHQQGRCSRLPKTLSWADLGYDIEEPEDVITDAETYFDSLPSTEQLEILGLKGYAAWQAGTYPIEMWSRRISTPGWRDSFHATSV